MQTIKQVEAEARRRIDEDGCPRVIYTTSGARLKICLLEDFDKTEVWEQAVSIVWEDKIEVL